MSAHTRAKRNVFPSFSVFVHGRNIVVVVGRMTLPLAVDSNDSVLTLWSITAVALLFPLSPVIGSSTDFPVRNRGKAALRT